MNSSIHFEMQIFKFLNAQNVLWSSKAITRSDHFNLNKTLLEKINRDLISIKIFTFDTLLIKTQRIVTAVVTVFKYYQYVGMSYDLYYYIILILVPIKG